jgi:hypothetical protein
MPDRDEITLLMNYLGQELPDAILRRSLRERCTVRPGHGLNVEPAIVAAERDVEELLKLDAVQRRIDHCLRSDPSITRNEVNLMINTTQTLAAMIARAAAESERDRYASTQTKRLRYLLVAFLCIACLIFVYTIYQYIIKH